MSGFEYKVVPAPVRGLKAKGVKGTQARFANALETLMNEHGAEGWEYQRTDTLPVEERQGLTGKTTTFQNMLVFRRLLADESEEAPVVAALLEHQSATAPEPVAPEAEAIEIAEADAAEADAAPAPSTSDATDSPEARARVEETLKAEPFVFPWDKRTRKAEVSDEADQRPKADDAR